MSSHGKKTISFQLIPLFDIVENEFPLFSVRCCLSQVCRSLVRLVVVYRVNDKMIDWQIVKSLIWTKSICKIHFSDLSSSNFIHFFRFIFPVCRFNLSAFDTVEKERRRKKNWFCRWRNEELSSFLLSHSLSLSPFLIWQLERIEWRETDPCQSVFVAFQTILSI